jgi:hypothetical protein
MIRGPIVIKNAESVLASANVGLEIAREKFALIVDLISEEMPAHFDLSITAKSTPSAKQVTLPTNAKSFQEMIKEIDALTTEVMPSNLDYTEQAPDTTGSQMMNTESTDVDSLLNTNNVTSPQ